MAETPRRARQLPLTPATVEINGYVYRPRNIIWAGLDWPRAEVRRDGMVGAFRSVPACYSYLLVPWTHPNDVAVPGEEAVYRIRPRIEGFAFTRARNGQWVLEMVS